MGGDMEKEKFEDSVNVATKVGLPKAACEWLEVVLPFMSSEIMGRPLVGLPMRPISDGDAVEVLERIQKLATAQSKMLA